MKSIIAASLLLASSVSTAADDSYKVDGVIGALHVGQSGQEVRIALENAPTLCGNTWTTAYIGAKDENFDTYFDALMAAKTGKLPVTLVTKKDAEGYCHLIYLILK